MGFVWTIIIGFVVGLLARMLHPGRDEMGFILTTLLGIGGALVAGFIGRMAGWYRPDEAAGFIASLIGAMLLLWISRRMTHTPRAAT
ncbi:MAG TPA: GlsB/YeaQ/YmgE family stress response membrane protein [Candidatus Binatia bacterium]